MLPLPRSWPLSPTLPPLGAGCGLGGGRLYRSLKHEVMGGGRCCQNRRRFLCISRGNGSPSSAVIRSPSSGAPGPESPPKGRGFWVLLIENLAGAQPAPGPATFAEKVRGWRTVLGRLRKAQMPGARSPFPPSSVIFQPGSFCDSLLAPRPHPPPSAQAPPGVFLKLLPSFLQTPPRCS